MPRALYASPYTVQHESCGTEVKKSYAVRSVSCPTCNDLRNAREWIVLEKGNERLDTVRAYEKEEYEKDEKIKLRKEIRNKTKSDYERSQIDDEVQESSRNYESSGKSRDSSSFEQESQGKFNEEFGSIKSNIKNSKTDKNILVQVLYNMHDLMAQKYSEAYSLRTLDDKTQEDLKECLVDVSEDLGFNIDLSPTQRFALLYGGILLSMKRMNKKEDYVIYEEEEIKEDNPLDDFTNENKKVWK